MRYKVTLTKVSTKADQHVYEKDGFTITGTTSTLPTRGGIFQLLDPERDGTQLSAPTGRMLSWSTLPVRHVKDNTFETDEATYEFKILEELPDEEKEQAPIPKGVGLGDKVGAMDDDDAPKTDSPSE